MARHDAMVHDASPTTLTAAVKPILAGGPIRSLYTGLRWAAVAVPAALAEDPIADSGLLQGFNDEELAAAQRAIPSRWVPRLITVTEGAYEDVNTNGERDADELAMPGVRVSNCCYTRSRFKAGCGPVNGIA